MNDEQKDLARRLARCPQYKPRAMSDDTSLRYCGTRVVRDTDGRLIPDLTSAATGGVLWEMAGRLLIVGVGESGFVSLQGPEMPEHGGATLMFGGDTLAEACARALLAEWGES